MVKIATFHSEIVARYPVMRELRPHIAEDAFVEQSSSSPGEPGSLRRKSKK